MSAPEAVDAVLLCGDVHSNAEVAAAASAAALANGCTAVLQVGDLGWRPGEAETDELCEAIGAGEVPWVFVDGNHDHLIALAAHAAPHRTRQQATDGGELDPDPDGLWGPAAPLRVGANLWWAARGARWTWGGVRFGALGGAWSPGWHFRRRGKRWFARETISRRDLDALGRDPLDVLVCHDMPAGALRREGSTAARRSDAHIGEANSRQVSEAVRRTQPALVVHGHWHHRYTGSLEPTARGAVAGLAANGEPGSLAVLSLDSLALTDASSLRTTS